MDDGREKQKSAAAQEESEQQPLPQQPPTITEDQRQYIRSQYKRGQDMKAAQREHDFEDRRTRIAEMLLPENRGKPVIINSRDEYLAMDAAYKSLSNKTDMDGQTMEGYPETDADWVTLTTRLAVAITDFTNVLDKPQNDQLGDGNTAVQTVKSLSTLEVQLLAGKILVATCDAHVGRYNIPSWPKVWKMDRYMSFEERLRDVCSALTHSKAIVKSIMDAEVPFATKFVTAPRSELEAKKDNKMQDDKTAENKKQMEKRPCEDDGSGDDDGDTGTALHQSSGVQKFKPRKRSYIMTESAARIFKDLHYRPAKGGADNDRGDQISTNDGLVICGPHDDPLGPDDDPFGPVEDVPNAGPPVDRGGD
ncbi:hypothetical protein KVR01_013297 [Diaporthe batatas]|uniref:uncharacterized protein n=1 Tax=Diaporthe batatas TaxID=748121 RepID=UPI001D0523B1|nr:uncharacterized protein KVR01_013297 [Diaporthe batatas]KAG8156884.1 hypothetical protein KVR01_013297 [Diaporthe batatas]